jgi:hypothetical protein
MYFSIITNDMTIPIYNLVSYSHTNSISSFLLFQDASRSIFGLSLVSNNPTKKLITKFYQRMQQNHKNHNSLRNYKPTTSSASIWCDSKIIKGTLERDDICYNKVKKT